MTTLDTAKQLFSSGLAALDGGDLAEAESLFAKTLAFAPNSIPTLSNLLFCRLQQKKFSEAIETAKRILEVDRDNIEPYHALAVCCSAMSRYDAALEACDNVLARDRKNSAALNNKGAILNKLGRHEEAIASLTEAIAINSEDVEAIAKMGNARRALKQLDMAISDYEAALAIKPDLESAWLGRGNVFAELRRHDEALAAYDRALSIDPDLEGAWLGRGGVFAELGRYEEAFAAYDRAFSIKPDLEGVEGARLNTKLYLCNWEGLEEEIGHLTNSVKCGKANSDPFALLSLTGSPDDHFRCARAWVAAKFPQAAEMLQQGSAYRHDKIHLGYVSAEFREHATSYLMAEVFELHDKNRFSISAFSLGPDDKSKMRQRLLGCFDRFVDCRKLSDADAARAIVDAEIDILVNLGGFMQDARTNIFACRPAPIQVNYLSYPGTMGAPYIDYIIGDGTIFSPDDIPAYSEKLVRLPYSYQPNDRKRRVSEKAFRRQDLGLPEEKFVFCCFNNQYKILPQVFDSWMRILKRAEGSVLWLLAEGRTATSNLRKEAARRGVDPARLVFAGRMEMPEHLARHSCADLFLDTLPYNAHTTASDALWTGLPVLTQAGTSFAGRVAASLLKAIGLPELITRSREEYEALATEMALDREKLQNIRERLDQNRLSAPLFDAPLFAGHLEAAYDAMYERYRAGLPPDHIEIQPVKMFRSGPG